MKKYLLCVFFILFSSGCVGTSSPTPHVPTQIPTNPALPTTNFESESTALPTIKPPHEETPGSEHDPGSDWIAIQAEGLQPNYVDDIQALQAITYYSIAVTVEFDPVQEIATFEGQTRITYTNPEDEPLHDLILMLWPNDDQYQAVMEAGPIMIKDQIADHSVELDGLALRVHLPQELQPGESLELSLPFSIRTEGSIRHARKRFGITNGVLMAPTFYPLIPRLVDGAWQIEAAPVGGDTTNSDVAYFEVTITTSEDYQIIASGVEVDQVLLRSMHQAVTFVTGPMRDFAFALGKLESKSKEVEGVNLNVWFLPWHLESAERMLEVAALQMQHLIDLVGPYPYVDLDLVDTPCSFGGIEYPGLMFICSLDDDYFVDTTIHEIAHQWFYGLIGNDQLHEPWLDESMATYWQVLYREMSLGSDQAQNQINLYKNWVHRPEDKEAPIGLGIDDYRLVGDYYTIVYFKGALFFDALRSEMGDADFFEFLRSYFHRYRYKFVDSLGFQAVAEQVCDCDLNELFNLWVYHGGIVLE